MTLNALQLTWHSASYLGPPSARCGHVGVVVDKLNDFGTELVVIHGGINSRKEALSDLHVLQVAQEQWLSLEPCAVGPAARAFHAAAVVGPRVYIFAGHVYLPEQKRLHQFNDLWALDTDTWQWHRMEAAPDAPAPPPRDRAAMVALDEHRLLIYGGADATNRRLDDAWVYDVREAAWREVAPAAGPRPKPRCSAALFPLGNRVLAFGGDVAGAGPTNELWSLKGALQAEAAGPRWTQLALAGEAPAPRRGHAAAPAEALGGVVFCGGLSEQKSLLGMKKQAEFLMDVALLQASAGALAWRGAEAPAVAGAETPLPREKHTMCALKDGRFFMYGGTDGTTTLGDAWWLSLEDFAAAPPALLSLPSDLERQLAAAPGSPSPPPAAASPAPSAAPRPTPPAASPSANGSYWGVLPSSLQAVVPQIATSALTSLRGRLGYPATPAGDAAAAAAAAGMAPVGAAAADDALLALGRAALGIDSSPDAYVRAARDFFCAVDPVELKIGALKPLLADYRRLARAGWAAALAAAGPEALAAADASLLGRYAHWSEEDVRMRDVGPILEDYRQLLAAAGEREAATAGAPAEAAPAPPEETIGAQPAPPEQEPLM